MRGYRTDAHMAVGVVVVVVGKVSEETCDLRSCVGVGSLGSIGTETELVDMLLEYMADSQR